MKKRAFNIKQILRLSSIFLLLASLVSGIGVSTYKVVENISPGSKFSKGFEAMVGVFDKSKKPDNDKGLPNGISSEAAKAIEQKLSPFSNTSVEIEQSGKSRVLVKAPKANYNNSQALFKESIERVGGLFILDKDYKDLLFNDEIMKKAGVDGVYNDTNTSQTPIKNKLSIDEFLGKARDESLQPGDTQTRNAPFVTFEIKEDYLKKLLGVSGDNKDNKNNTPTEMTMITSMGSVLSRLRSYYVHIDQSESNANKNKFLNVYLNEIIKQVRQWISSNGAQNSETANALIDLFAINYKIKNNTGEWVNAKASLVGKDIKKWWKSDSEGGIDDLVDLKHVLYGQNDLRNVTNVAQDYEFEFINSTNKYLYDSNSKADDFNDVEKDGKGKGKYFGQIQATSGVRSLSGTSTIGPYYKVASEIISVMMKEVLFRQTTIAGGSTVVNKNLKQDLFRDQVLLNNKQISAQQNQRISSRVPALVTDKQSSATKLYIPVANYTMSTQIVSDIVQTTLGYEFKVLSIEENDEEITPVMLYVTIVFLAILSLAVMIFMVFAYRLLGLFAIIIAAISGSLTLLLPIVFSITVGPEILTLLFISVGLVLDTCIIYFEAFKKNIHAEKRSPESSFNISNKDTLTILLDASFIILIPNILLFILGSGALKSIATIGVISILFVIVFAIITLRILTWLSIKAKLFTNYPWLLPFNTQRNYESSLLNDIRVSYYNSKIENLNSKEKLTAKDLAKLKQAKDKYNFYKDLEQKIIAQRKDKKLKKDAIQISTINQKIAKIVKRTKNNKFFSFFAKSRIKDLEIKRDLILAELNTQSTKEELSTLKNRSNQRKIFNVNKIFSIFFMIFMILGISLGFSVGPNYNVSFGNSVSVTMYGNQIDDIYNRLDSIFLQYQSTETSNGNVNRANRIRQMGKVLVDYKLQEDNFISRTEFNNRSYDELTNSEKYRWSAFVTSGVFKKIFDDRYFDLWNSRSSSPSSIYRLKLQIEYGSNFVDVLSRSNEANELPWVSFRITNLKDKTVVNVFERFLYNFKTFSGNPDATTPRYDHSRNSSDEGIINLINTPYTSFGQIKQMAIVFGIALIALSVYMIIRFKWTYFVALALSVALTVLLVVSLVVVLRVPVGIEILGAVLAVLSFAVITSVLILGKGKSIMKSKSLKAFSEVFDKEVNVSSEIRAIKHEIREKSLIVRKEFKTLLKQKVNDKIQELGFKNKVHKLWLTIIWKYKFIFSKKENQSYKEYKLKQKEIKSVVKQNKQRTDKKLDSLISNNSFLKEVFVNVFTFGLNRTLLVTVIYITYALIISLCMPSIIGMGVTIIIGVLISTLVSLVIALPLWILLERKRIIYILGYKHFVQNYRVSQEEQIIVGIND
ncbi:protein translocase SecDF, variant type [Mycoplasma yeatsii]|uniref:protein translocase SecDF, variant type n=1 Tax=Mycoplasma yeatsii TaxID=51365 RepID=UPI0005B246D8|nr:protein translocase SecDF, variant type [Mycoplasma yeatsii]AJM71807.1 bifunctional preprotein translocase subunit SecD/SecF [Mycoplasma yeatsii GM274B]